MWISNEEILKHKEPTFDMTEKDPLPGDVSCYCRISLSGGDICLRGGVLNINRVKLDKVSS